MKRRACLHLLLTGGTWLSGGGAARAGSFDDFFQAIRQNDAAVLQGLLRRGFDPNTRDAKGVPGLVLAVQVPAPAALQALLQASQLQVDAMNPQGETALMLASLKGHIDLVRALLAKDPDVNKTGWTALHYAATGTTAAQLDIARLLIEHHAYIDAESPNQSTPLMMASMYGLPAMVQLLLEEGADPQLRNQQGLSAIDFAQRAGRKESAEAIAAAIRRRAPKGSW